MNSYPEFMHMLLDLTPLISFQLILILSLRPVLRHYFGPIQAYRLWLLLPIWNLLLMLGAALWHPAPAAGFAVSNGLAPLDGLFMDWSTATAYSISPPTDTGGTSGPFLSLWQLLFLVWALGFAALIGRLLWQLRRLVATITLAREDAVPAEISQALQELAPDLSIAPLFVPDLSSPSVVGIFRQQLLLPKDFHRSHERATLELILKHELVHLRRRDNLINLLAYVCYAIFWFNPLLYCAYRSLRQDQEASCDAQAIVDSSPSERGAFADALAGGSRRQPVLLGASDMGSRSSKSELKTRLRLILTPRHRAPGGVGSLLICLMITLGTLGCTAVARNTVSLPATTDANSLPAETIPENILAQLDSDIVADIARSRASLTPVPADSEYLAFVIDTSGSMFNNPSWNLLTGIIEATASRYPNLQGVQLLNDMGAYLQHRGQWIDANATNLDALSRALQTWNPYSNSSPVEGIETVLSQLGAPGQRISIYVIGDDSNPDMDLDAAIDSISSLVPSSSGEVSAIRIHGIMIPTIFAGPPDYRESAQAHVRLMRALTRQNGGTFEVLPSYEELPPHLR